jgi:hypothetical protein
MWRPITAVAVSMSLAVPALGQSADAKLWQPNPVTMALTIGKWLMKERERIYYLQVEASGLDEPAALTSAFRLAVSQALGSLILSESEVRNQEVVRNDIINYSSGYVDDYKILDRSSQNGLVVITVDVWVKQSRLSERLLNQSRGAGEINGAQTRIQADTLTHSRREGDLVLNAVLGDFPGRAFTVTPGPTKTFYSDRRNRSIELTFRVEWSRDYLESLREALSQVAQNANAGDCLGSYARKCDYRGYVTIKARPGRHGWSRIAAFNDAITMNLVEQHFIHSRPAVLVTVHDDRGQIAWRGCSRYSELDNVLSGIVPADRLVQSTENGVLINGWLALDARMPMNLAQDAPNLERASFEVVRGDRCPNN